ncbi:Aste57867_13474 [Aphanomyces stellatus]|uniref:Aste57867_13474 protein n=1 Tax=Aphanomyces stellatus TaxID=120398 RepID=A0A485KY79_9STRA|nr:hypothetical protein As57867_013424 [Aphanomyces stellatus]VFT90312.1 Aste57867_13474 [Aphanomyces stellatus]
MNGVATDEHHPAEERLFLRHSHLREFVCGGSAAAINIVSTFVPNKIMFRQQLYGISAVDAWASLRADGWHLLYRGVSPPLMQATVSKSIMFGLYNSYHDVLTGHFGDHMLDGVVPTATVAALLTGTSEAVLAPFERVQTLLQTVKYNHEFTTATDAFVRIHATHGLRENYRGLTAIVLRNAPSNVLFFGLRDHVRDLLPDTTTAGATLAADFVSGAVLGASLNTLFFPLNVAKTRMQSVYGDVRFISITEALRLTYEERGRSIAKVYRGVELNFFRSLVSWGIINAAYEKLMTLTE